jgi:hypothetical protein
LAKTRNLCIISPVNQARIQPAGTLFEQYAPEQLRRLVTLRNRCQDGHCGRQRTQIFLSDLMRGRRSDHIMEEGIWRPRYQAWKADETGDGARPRATSTTCRHVRHSLR